MPHERAYNYYHWSMDKPCTTNQVYGFQHRELDASGRSVYKPLQPIKKSKLGPFDYTRPFSNQGFFPAIADQTRMTEAVLPRASLHPSADYNPPSSINRFDINRGYTMGYIPIQSRVVKCDPPSGFKTSRTISAPPAYAFPESRGKNLLLWHTLAGTLVQVRHHPPPKEVCASTY